MIHQILSKLTPEEMIGGLVLIAVAFGIVSLNDRLRERSRPSAGPKKQRTLFPIFGLLILAAVLWGTGTKEKWIIAVGMGVVALLTFVWMRVVSKFALGKVVVDGKGKCPKCGGDVTYNPVEIGATAFECSACGESGKWT
jgi:hypothetical protein